MNIIINLTELCNLKCSYCYYSNTMESSKVKHFSKKNIITLFDRLNESKIREMHFIIHGGEPLLDKDLLRFFFEQQKKLKINVSNTIQTNGTLFDDDILYILDDYSIDSIGISVDGLQKENDFYRKYKNGKGSYQVICDGLDRLEKKGIPFTIISVVNPINSDPTKLFNFLSKYSNLKQYEYLLNQNLNGDEYKEISKYLIKLYDVWTQSFNELRLINFESIEDMFNNKYSIKKCMTIKNCFSELYNISIRPNGDVLFCDTGENLILGSYLLDDFDKILCDAKFKLALNSRNEKYRIASCYQCRWFRFCFGYCPAFSIKPCNAIMPLFEHIENKMSSK